MLRKLRHKFIATAMCSIAAVLLLIMSAINIANYVNVCNRADSRITMIADNGGHLDPTSANTPPKSTSGSVDSTDKNAVPDAGKKPSDGPDNPQKKDGMSPEAMFDTRFFTVTL